MDITILSTADWDHPFWTNKQHTAKELVKLGHKVLYVDSTGLRKIEASNSDDKSRIKRKILKFFQSPIKVEKNIYVISPLIIPLHDNFWISKFNALFLGLTVKLAQISIGLKNEILWTFNPMSVDTAKVINPKYLIYNNVDDLTAAPGMPKNLEKEEIELFKNSNLVFNTSTELHNRASRFTANSFEFTNVADYKHFSKATSNLEKPSELNKIKGPIIGFIGAISPYKVDIKLINNYAKKNPDKDFVFIGKVGEGQPGAHEKFQELSNIHLLGPKDYQSLPNFLRYFDVLIIPSVLNNYTKSMFPMKFFEYLATEKPIVARNLDSLKKFDSVYYGYDTESDFSNSIDLSLTQGCKDLSKARELSREYTWENRLYKMMKLVTELEHS